MHSVPIRAEHFGDNRFSQLQEAMGWTRAETLGVLVLLWHGTRSRELGRTLTREQVLAALPCAKDRKPKVLQALIDADYVKEGAGVLVVIDNAPYFAASDKMSEAGKRGGWPMHKKHPPKKAPKPKNPLPPVTTETWDAFSSAHVARYGVEPKRNVKVNSQLLQLVQRIGKEDAPRLARFYVAHDGRYFVRASHPIGLLVANAEGLYTQMQRDEPMTDHAVNAQTDGGRLEAQLRRFGAGGQ